MGAEYAPQTIAVPLASIRRLSPLNPRQDMDSDVSDLAAMIAARGQQIPIRLRPIQEQDDPSSGCAGAERDDQNYEVLDGGRRWRALRRLAEQGDARDALAVIEAGDDVAAREIALMISVSPKPLHPVDEYESFARLEEAGLGVEAIAAHFGESVRHIRQRLALGRLAPRVREKWREGAIDREQAEAFAAGPVAAQEALLDQLEGAPAYYDWDAIEIRRKLRGETLSNSGPEGKFLLADKARVEAYIAQGGRIEDNLFEDEIIIHDPTLARRIVNDALRAEAERIRVEEGWGAALIGEDGADPYDEPDEPEFFDAESARLDEIANEERSGEADQARLRALDDERDAIIRDALLRMLPLEARAIQAVGAFLDHKGRLYVARALPLPDANPSGANPLPVGEGGSRSEPGEGLPLSGDSSPALETATPTRAQPPAIHDPLAEPGPALRAIIDDAATQALRDIARRRGDIALMLAVATLGCMYGAEVVKLSLRGGGPADEADDSLLARIADERFDVALAICAAAPTGDLSVALFRLIAASIETRDARFETIGAVCAAVRARGGDLNAAFSSALDRRGFFEAAPKQITLGCVAGLIGEGEAGRVKKMKKPELADYVARLSKDKGHLPAPLADWAAAPELPDARTDAILTDAEPSLAEAMDQAIAADSAQATSKKPRAPRKGKKTP